MFVSMMLASTLEIKEKTAKVYFKNFITPTSDALFIFSNFVTNLIIIILQLAVLFGVAMYFFKEQILSVLTNLIIIPLIIATVFILLGMVLGNVFRSEETSTLGVISLGFIFLFFSSTILPIETLPGVIGKIAAFNPFFIGERLLNQVLLFQSPLQPLLPSLYILGGYIIGLIILTVVTKKIAKRRM
jgi:ABC-type polysaccharide/polyol phosphate export permease